MKEKKALLIFQKNAELGKVKTRLAATMGQEKALEVYTTLVRHCYQHLASLKHVDIFIFFTERIEEVPKEISHLHVNLMLQTAGDLGQRMFNAFEKVHNFGYHQMAIIGTDCPEISVEIIESAFRALSNNDVVFGPALDGGYYLLGLKTVNPLLFNQMTWSTSTVLQHSLERCQKAGLKTQLLTGLRDVDTEADWLYFAPLFASKNE